MSKRKSVIIVCLIVVCLLALVGSYVLVSSLLKGASNEGKGMNIETFSTRTDVDEFQTVPVVAGKDIKISEPEDYGEGNYLIGIEGVTREEYTAYEATMEQAGFQKHSDNGEDAMEGYALTSAFQKDNLTVVIAFVLASNKMYVTAAYDLALSDHMIYKKEYVEGLDEGAQTKVHMVELNDNGACFIIQLKNGHYVVHDGGNDVDTRYFLDYINELTPGEEKPVIEAWFLSHAHPDHYGVLNEINTNARYADKLTVNAVYYHAPTSAIFERVIDTKAKLDVYLSARSNKMLKAEDGSQTKFYRPQLGQRYYFCDIYIDVAMTPEQYTLNSYELNGTSVDMNDTSIWLMHHIEDQRMLLGGDSYHTAVRSMMNMYEESYFNLDMFAVLHHGMNVYNYFTDYMTPQTVLYPNFRVGSIWEPSQPQLALVEENAYLQSVAKESLSCADGTVVLAFPYHTGEATTLGPREWIYNGGRDYKIHQ